MQVPGYDSIESSAFYIVESKVFSKRSNSALSVSTIDT